MFDLGPGPTYPFGERIAPVRAVADGPRPVFVLGAYPSAFHVKWTLPMGAQVAAIAVANEPEPWWRGDDEWARFDAWLSHRIWDLRWGEVEPAGRFNGSSGCALDERVLAPLAVTRLDAWITDIVDTHFASVAGGARVEDTYAPFAVRHGLATASLPPHPSEARLVATALGSNAPRLRAELGRARPDLVVTLGNAAARVLAKLVGYEGDARVSVASYGAERVFETGGRKVRWLALAHTAAPVQYRAAHEAWVLGRQAVSRLPTSAPRGRPA